MSISYQEAIAYSFNYATAKPDIGNTEREHILGLCAALEAVGKERDTLAAHVERLRTAFRATIDSDWSAPMEESLEETLDAGAATSLARRDARVAAEALHELLMQPDSSAVGTRQRAMDNRDHYRRLAEGASDA
ncbi:MAG: hypothetical protein L0J73_11750 [Halomonas sp.]|nr:hypothetical protein [Halomonas sp.]